MADAFWVICRGCERELQFGEKCEECAQRATWGAVITRGLPEVLHILLYLAALAIALTAATLMLRLRSSGSVAAALIPTAVVPASVVMMAIAGLSALLAGLAMIASKGNWALWLMRIGAGFAVIAAVLAGLAALV